MCRGFAVPIVHTFLRNMRSESERWIVIRFGISEIVSTTRKPLDGLQRKSVALVHVRSITKYHFTYVFRFLFNAIYYANGTLSIIIDDDLKVIEFTDNRGVPSEELWHEVISIHIVLRTQNNKNNRCTLPAVS